MEKESLRNGTAFTTMHTTMIWEILTRVQSMSALFLVGLLGILILVGEEQAEQQQNQEFPPKSKLNSKQYGDQNSSITEEHIKDNLDGLTMDEAIKNNRMFILDHHDKLMPYLRRINTTTTKTYASRTLLFLKDDGSHL